MNDKIYVFESNETQNEEFCEIVSKDMTIITKPKGIGARHGQALLLLLSFAVSFTIRSHLGVTIVAMTSKCDSLLKSNGNFNEPKTKLDTNTSYNTQFNDNSLVAQNIYHNYSNIDGSRAKRICNNFKVYEWHKSTQEIVLVSFFWGYTFMQIPMGMVAQKFGGKTAIMIGLLANGILSIATPWAAAIGGWLGVCGCRILQGATQAALLPGINNMLGKWAPLAERGFLVTIIFNGVQIGAVFGLLISGILAESEYFGWPSTFWVLGVLCIISSGIIWWLGASSPRSHAYISEQEFTYITQELGSVKVRPTPWGNILQSKTVWAVIFCHAGSYLSQSFIMTEIPLYFKSILAFNLKDSSLLTSLSFVVMSIVCPLLGKTSDCLIAKKYLTVVNARRMFNSIGMFVSGALLMPFCYVNNISFAIVLLILSTSLHSGVFSGLHVSYIDISPNFTGAITGLGNMIAVLSSTGLLALTMSNIVGDDLTNHNKWRIVIFIVVIIMFVVNAIYIYAVKPAALPWDDDDPRKNSLDDRKANDIPRIPKPKGFGARHAQSFILLMCLIVGFSIRSHLGVSLVAMTKIQGNYKASTEVSNESESSNFSSYDKKQFDLDEDGTYSPNNVYKVYSWHKATQEIIFISFFIGYICMQLPMGIIIQRFGGKIPIAMGLFLNGILSIVTPWAALWGGWFGVSACRLFQGVTQASICPGINNMLGKWAPLAERGLLVSIVLNGAQLGTVFGFQIAGFLADSHLFGWPSSFWILGVMCILSSGIVWWFGSSSPSTHASISEEELAYITQELKHVKVPPAPWRKIFKSKSVWGLIICHVGSNISQTFALNQTPLYFRSVLGMNFQNIGFLSSLPFALMSIVCPLFGVLSDYLIAKGYLSVLSARKLFTSIGLFGCAFFLVAFGFVSNVSWAVVLLMLSTSSHAGVMTGLFVSYIDISPNYSCVLIGMGSMMAHLISSSTIALTMSIIVGDDTTNPYKWRIVIIIIAFIMFTANTIYLFTAKATPRSWNNSGLSDDFKQTKETESNEHQKRNLHLINYKLIPQTVPDIKKI